jgi:alpha-tubulin suppressor-like RCC1 family protein
VGKVHQGVAAGGNYSFLLRDDDMLISWGGGDWEAQDRPRYHYRYPDGNDFTVIAAGSDHIMALTYDGKAFDWDWPVGTPEFDDFSRPVPPDVVFIKDIDGGYDFSVALHLP